MSDSKQFKASPNITFSGAGWPSQSVAGARVSDAYHNTDTGEVFRCKVETLGSQEWIGDQGSQVPSDIWATDHPNLVAMYTMDNISGSTLLDESANAYNGTITGATQVAGKIGNALDFSANPNTSAAPSAWVYLPSRISLSADFSISLWVDIDITRHNRGCFVGETTPLDPDYSRFIYFDDLNIIRYSAKGTNSDSPSITLSDGYRHLVLTRSGSSLTLYVDSVPTITWTDLTAANPFLIDSIGTYVNPDNVDTPGVGDVASIHCNWDLDHLRVFNRDLTQSEITALANET